MLKRAYTGKTEQELREIYSKKSNAEILKEFPSNLPTKIASVLMNIPERHLCYGIKSGSERFLFGTPIEKSKKTTYWIDTQLFLNTIPQRKGR